MCRTRYTLLSLETRYLPSGLGEVLLELRGDGPVNVLAAGRVAGYPENETLYIYIYAYEGVECSKGMVVTVTAVYIDVHRKL